MPVTYIHIQWPNEEEDQVYSPSSIIENYFTPQQEITVTKFNALCNESLTKASDRVAKKFGFACTSAMAEMQRITSCCKNHDGSEKVKIIAIK